MIIDCISDLHGHYPKLEGGDLLIVAGDLTARDLENEYALFDYWLNEQKYAAKIIIGGNHDNFLQKFGKKYIVGERPYFQFGTYLEDSGTEFQYVENEIIYNSDNSVILDVAVKKMKKLKIWGSPWTKTFKGMSPNCKAYTVDTEEELAEKFSLIPDDIDILICHSPAYMILDKIIQNHHVGSSALLEAIDRVKPKLFVCAHIHEAYGTLMYKYQMITPCRDTRCVNASHVNERYQPVNKPVRVIL